VKTIIRLPGGAWSYDQDKQLGPRGGFGTVFEGESDDGRAVAVKRLHVDAEHAAHRELRIAAELKGKSHKHVIPVYDSGIDAESDSYFVVMARAERSLQEELRQRGTFTDADAIEVLLQIARGLNEVGQLVHRDLKPGNVLLHDGAWKIADFGIARFVEDATSINTLNECLSPPYAAPEQWRREPVGQFTDLYALGCIGHALLTGKPPFAGPDFSKQHQHAEPPSLDGHQAALRSLLSFLLRKSPGARVDLPRVIAILTAPATSSSSRPGFTALSEVGAAAVARQSAQEAKQAAENAGREARKQLVDNGKRIFEAMVKRLFAAIRDSFPIAKVVLPDENIQVEDAHLKISMSPDRFGPDQFPQSKWDVPLFGTIAAYQPNPLYVWAATLLYARLKTDEAYRWYEASFMVNPMFGYGVPSAVAREGFQPFALLDAKKIDEVAGPAMGVFQFAFGPRPIDDENVDEFDDRWAGLLAKAAAGQLEQPRSLPL